MKCRTILIRVWDSEKNESKLTAYQQLAASANHDQSMVLALEQFAPNWDLLMMISAMESLNARLPDTFIQVH